MEIITSHAANKCITFTQTQFAAHFTSLSHTHSFASINVLLHFVWFFFFLFGSTLCPKNVCMYSNELVNSRFSLFSVLLSTLLPLLLFSTKYLLSFSVSSISVLCEWLTLPKLCQLLFYFSLCSFTPFFMDCSDFK